MARIALATIFVAALSIPNLQAQEARPTKEAATVLEKHCAGCHSGDRAKRKGNKEFDVLSSKSLLETKPRPLVLEKFPGTSAYVVPNDLAVSLAHAFATANPRSGYRVRALVAIRPAT
jgi:hypothetical protein